MVSRCRKLALWRKWRLEERFMRETFGQAYCE
jgi:hypothetical protein